MSFRAKSRNLGLFPKIQIPRQASAFEKLRRDTRDDKFSSGSRHNENCWNRRAFTVLELLMSMTILLVVLSILASILGASSDLWERGLRRNRLLASGRAALDKIADDLQQAVADTNVTFYVSPPLADPDVFGFECNEIFFHALADAAGDDLRAIRRIWYGVRPLGNNDDIFELRRGFIALSASELLSPFNLPNPSDPSDHPDPDNPNISPLLEGVAAFRVLVRNDPLLPDSGDPFANLVDYESPPVDPPDPLFTLPLLVDIYLELLTPKDSERAAGFSDPDARADFMARNALRLTRRVVLSQRKTP